MTSAPVWAGAALCCHRAKSLGLAAGLCRGLLWRKSPRPPALPRVVYSCR